MNTDKNKKELPTKLFERILQGTFAMVIYTLSIKWLVYLYPLLFLCRPPPLELQVFDVFFLLGPPPLLYVNKTFMR